MSKFLLGSSFLSLALLLSFTIHDPNNAIVWLASSSHGYIVARCALMIIILVLLTTHSFLNIPLRIIIGMLAGGLWVYTCTGTFNNQIQLEDAMTLLMVGISAVVTVLEPAAVKEDVYIKPAIRSKRLTPKVHLSTS